MFVIDIPQLDLGLIYQSQQTFNWTKIDTSTYLIRHKDKILKVKQNEERFYFFCSEADFFNLWYNYFDVGCDYQAHTVNLYVHEDIKINYTEKYEGLRILNQDAYEVLLTSLILSAEDATASNTAFRIKEVCKLGFHRQNSLGETGTVKWRQFPKAEQIQLKANRLTSILPETTSKKLLSLAQDILEGWFCVEELEHMDSTRHARTYLEAFDYLNDESINRTLAFGLRLSTDSLDAYSKRLGKEVAYQFKTDLETFKDWYTTPNCKSNNLLSLMLETNYELETKGQQLQDTINKMQALRQKGK